MEVTYIPEEAISRVPQTPQAKFVLIEHQLSCIESKSSQYVSVLRLRQSLNFVKSLAHLPICDINSEAPSSKPQRCEIKMSDLDRVG